MSNTTDTVQGNAPEVTNTNTTTAVAAPTPAVEAPKVETPKAASNLKPAPQQMTLWKPSTIVDTAIASVYYGEDVRNSKGEIVGRVMAIRAASDLKKSTGLTRKTDKGALT